MTKLHELLAIEGELEGQASRDLAEATGLFENGSGKFLGQTAVYRSVKEVEPEAEVPAKVTRVATSVAEQLEVVTKSVSKWIDTSLGKEVTNQATEATLTFGQFKIDLPATALLNLENKLLKVRAVYKKIPTNDDTIAWHWADDIGLFVSDPDRRLNTQKVMDSFTKAIATREHPEQTEVFTRDKVIGHTTITKQSGMLTPKDKRARLERLETLIRSVKQARQRANNIEVDAVALGNQIFTFIDGE